MVTGRSESGVRYYPEKANHPKGIALPGDASGAKSAANFVLVGETPDQQHLANFLDCVRSRKEPNASVEIGYRTAVAAHMANLAYRRKTRVTPESATSLSTEL
jgi:hypothetical protein